jgi:AAHS family 4-hydroxybenzoate transporter-like MFS transporter
METLGWRTLFAIAGLATLGLATLLLFILPESPRYLVQDAGRRQKLAALLGKLSIDTHGSSTFVDGHQPLVRVDGGILFRRGHLGDTLALCGAFFFFNLSSYSFLSWLPALLAQLGLNYTMLGITTALFNLGGIFGALAGAYAITRLGTRLPMLLLCATSVAGALLLMYSKNIVDFSPWVLAGSLALMSGALGIVQCALYPLAVHMFPPGVRATGVGAAAAVGRVGSLTSSFTAAIALDLGGAKLFFISVAVVLAIGGVCLFFIRRHGPPAPSGAASVPVGEALTEGNSTPA